MSSMKASVEGLLLVKQAIAKKGWRIRDDRWLVAASYILEPDGDWRPDGPYAYGCSLQTWERFLQRVAIRDRSFLAFCKVLELSPIQVADTIFASKTTLSNEIKSVLKTKALEEKACSDESFRDLLSWITSLERRIRKVEHQLDATLSDSLKPNT